MFFLYIIKPFKHVKLIWFFNERIGAVYNNELVLRRIQLNSTGEKGILYIGLASTNRANQQLEKMYRRKLPIIHVPGLRAVTAPIGSEASGPVVKKKSIIAKSPFYQQISTDIWRDEYYDFNRGKSSLSFTEREEEEGKELLAQLGISDKDWFICFHSRDATYLSNLTKGDKAFRLRVGGFQDYRDSNIEDYLEAAKYIVSCGGFTIRMGYDVARKLPDLDNPRIIDYATNHRSDFGDIYLSARCKFFLGSSAGLYSVPTIFGVPVACANYAPLECTPWREGDLFIPKKLWSIKKKRYLTFPEILGSEVGHYFHSEPYTQAGIKLIANTPEEILGLAREMNERLDGAFEYTEEDEELQNRYHSLFQPHHRCYGTPARIGTEFLRQNRELLE